MGFSSVVLVGHDDGGLVALRAAQRVQASISSSNVSELSMDNQIMSFLKKWIIKLCSLAKSRCGRRRGISKDIA